MVVIGISGSSFDSSVLVVSGIVSFVIIDIVTGVIVSAVGIA